MKKQETEFVYGNRRGSWFSLTRYKTQKEAEKAGINDMIDQILNGYAVLEDYGIFKKEWTSEWDNFGIIRQTTSTEYVLGICKEYVDSVDWFDLMFDRVSNMDVSEAGIRKIREQMNNLKDQNRLSERSFENLDAVLWEKSKIRKIISGDFIEGSKVTVNIDGFIVSRRVYWSAEDKDLYIIYDKKKYFYMEFWKVA